MFGNKSNQCIYVNEKTKGMFYVLQQSINPPMVLTKNRFNQEKVKTVKIFKYNKYMSGINHVDQMVNHYSSPRKTLKWYKQFLFHLLDITIWNTFYLYKIHFKCYDMRFKEFRDLIIKSFLQVSPNVTATELFHLKTKKITNKHQKINNIIKNLSQYLKTSKEASVLGVFGFLLIAQDCMKS